MILHGSDLVKFTIYARFAAAAVEDMDEMKFIRYLLKCNAITMVFFHLTSYLRYSKRTPHFNNIFIDFFATPVILL